MLDSANLRLGPQLWGATGENRTPRRGASEETGSGVQRRQGSGSATPRRRAEVESAGVTPRQSTVTEAETTSSGSPRRLAGEMSTIVSRQQLPKLHRSHSTTELETAVEESLFPNGECLKI